MRAIVLFLALTLLVTGVLADDPHDALAPNHLALVANLLDARTDLHGLTRLLSLVAIGDSPAARIVWAHFDGDAVAGEDADVELPHPSADRRQHDQPVVAFDAEHRVRQRLLNDAVELELVALGLLALTTFTPRQGLLIKWGFLEKRGFNSGLRGFEP